MSKSLLYGLTPYGEKQVRHHLSNRANKLAKYLIGIDYFSTLKGENQ